jgi:hypothetical protein
VEEMRKIHVFMMLSLDGFFEGPNHDLSWHNVDDEFNKFAIEQLEETGLALRDADSTVLGCFSVENLLTRLCLWLTRPWQCDIFNI